MVLIVVCDLVLENVVMRTVNPCSGAHVGYINGGWTTPLDTDCGKSCLLTPDEGLGVIYAKVVDNTCEFCVQNGDELVSFQYVFGFPVPCYNEENLPRNGGNFNSWYNDWTGDLNENLGYCYYLEMTTRQEKMIECCYSGKELYTFYYFGNQGYFCLGRTKRSPVIQD